MDLERSVCVRTCGFIQYHLFKVQVDYRLFGTGWCMVDALVYVDILISVEDCCLISAGAKNVS